MEKTFQFSLDIIKYCQIVERQKQFVIARQLLKSGTSVGANIREARNPESRADFIHKFKIAAKEAEETKYWLELCQFSEGYPDSVALQEQLTIIQKIIRKIISTSKRSYQ